MENQIWSIVLSLVGTVGFYFVGKKMWWAWYINVACQGLWFTYAIVSKQYGFFIGVVVFGFVFTKNAIEWTREHKRVDALLEDPDVDGEAWSVYQAYCANDVVVSTVSLYNEQEKSRMKSRIQQLERENNEIKARLNLELRRRDLLR